MDALEALRTRRSVRVFENTPVDRTTVETIVDCGRLGASARNEQPWEFVAVTDAGIRRRIADRTNHGKHIAGAPVCIAVLSRPADYYLEDGAAATQNMLVAARACGLGACWIAGDKKDYARDICEILEAPAECRLVSLIALGHPGRIPSPAKRSLSDVLHWERF